jgi:hypothetical protein
MAQYAFVKILNSARSIHKPFGLEGLFDWVIWPPLMKIITSILRLIVGFLHIIAFKTWIFRSTLGVQWMRLCAKNPLVALTA